MFVISDLEHVVQIEPDEMEMKFEEVIIEKLDYMLANKVLKDVGLCITFYDFINIGSSYIPQGSATVYVPVQFRYLVFTLISGEVIDCNVLSSSQDGIKVTTKFCEDIIVPKEKLPKGSIFDSNTQTWNWHFKSEDNELVFPIEIGLDVRVLIESLDYISSKAGGCKMRIIAGMNQPGLGSQKWWNEEGGEENEVMEVEG